MSEEPIQEEQLILEETPTEIEKEEIPPPKEKPRNDKEFNFRQLESEKKRLQQEAEELKRQLEEIRRAKEERDESDDDDIAEMRHVKKVTNELNALKEQIRKQQEAEIEREKATVPTRLTSKFTDFNDVVSEENINRLKSEEPELFSALVIDGENPSPDEIYRKGVAAYKTLKSMGYANKEAVLEKEQFTKTSHAPRSSQTIKGQSAFSDKNVFAGGLTKELKAQMLREMNEATKNY